MTEPLKPCPCGSKAELHEDIYMSGKGQFWVQSEAGWVGPTKSEPDDAVDAWNTRLDAYLASPGNTDAMTIAKYDDELRKASPAPVWRDISTAPRDHTRILLFVPPYGVSCGHFDCVWENGVERWIMHSVLNKDAQPTAWMPLPDAPDGGLAR